MLFAINNNIKCEPAPGAKALCQCCQKEVLARCGDIYVWHWAHKRGEACDSWHEPETFWHRVWKMSFGIDSAEVVIINNNKRHIADVYTKDGVVIELQNSPIQQSTVQLREEFYGEKMIWVINARSFSHNIYIRKNDPSSNPFEPDPIRGFGYRLKQHKLEEPYEFDWSRPRSCWTVVKRNVFLDFGDDKLFWIKPGNGMGLGAGYGRYITKEKFITHYCGDYSYYKSHQHLIREEDERKFWDKMENLGNKTKSSNF